jgi:hypothetical protein
MPSAAFASRGGEEEAPAPETSEYSVAAAEERQRARLENMAARRAAAEAPGPSVVDFEIPSNEEAVLGGSDFEVVEEALEAGAYTRSLFSST